jgi:hypothetical protein
MIIKRWNGSAFVKEFPQTKAQLIRNNGDTENVFDGNDKIKLNYLPDAVFDTLRFADAFSASSTAAQIVDAMVSYLDATVSNGNIANAKGLYFVMNSGGTIADQGSGVAGATNTTKYALWSFDHQDNGSQAGGSGVLESGDWIVITHVSGAGTVGSPYNITFVVVNNAYELATTALDGIVRLSSRTTYAALTGNNVVTEGVLKTVIDNASFALSTHVHGNITNAGAIGSTADLVVVTGASGVLTTQSRSGIDSRTEFTPASHTHGNITNVGAIGSTANLPLITTTSGVITTGTFGSTANTFTQGNDARLSDARTPLSHVHGDITNSGAITSAAITPATGDYIILSDSSGADVLKRGIAIGTSTTTYLRNDGTWVTPPDTNTTYSEATTSTLGLVELAFAKLGSSPALTETTTAGRYYGVSLNSNSQMQVNVPWTDTTYSAGEGITLSSTTFRMTYPLYVSTTTPTTAVTSAIWYDIN